jgi:hypothetical protein
LNKTTFNGSATLPRVLSLGTSANLSSPISLTSTMNPLVQQPLSEGSRVRNALNNAIDKANVLGCTHFVLIAQPTLLKVHTIPI